MISAGALLFLGVEPPLLLPNLKRFLHLELPITPGDEGEEPGETPASIPEELPWGMMTIR